MKLPTYLAQIGTGVLNGYNPSDQNALANLIKNLLTYAFMIGGLLMMYNLFMGALNWIQSAGDKDKVEKARKQIVNAIIGFIILMLVWILFFTLTSSIFGIFTPDGNGDLKFALPSLF